MELVIFLTASAIIGFLLRIATNSHNKTELVVIKDKAKSSDLLARLWTEAVPIAKVGCDKEEKPPLRDCYSPSHFMKGIDGKIVIYTPSIATEQKAEANSQAPTIPCRCCGKEIEKINEYSKFCSSRCATTDLTPDEHRSQCKKCKQCNKPIISNGHNNAQFCSETCLNANIRSIGSKCKCPHCGTTVLIEGKMACGFEKCVKACRHCRPSCKCKHDVVALGCTCGAKNFLVDCHYYTRKI